MAHRGYIAEQNENGTWNILDVPIFAADTLVSEQGDEVPFDVEWMEEAVAWHQFKFREDSFLQPTNVHHDSDERGKMHAGRFLPKVVREFRFDGQDQQTLFADLLRIEDHVYQDIKRGVLEYLSVECNDVRYPRFSALALMPDTTPHFKFPPLSIAEERHVSDVTNPQSAAIAACEAGGVGLRLSASSAKPLRRFEMAEDKKPDEIEAMDDDAKKTEAMDDGASSGESEADKFFGKKRTLDEWNAILARVQEIVSGDAGGDVEANEDEEDDENPSEPISMSEDRREAVMATAKNRALEQRIEAMEARDKRRDSIAAAEARLTGYVVQDGELEGVYDKKGGAEALGLYVDTILANRPKPTTSPSEFSESDMTGLPAGFEFSSDPAQAGDQLKAYRQWDKLPASYRARVSRERHVELSTKPMSDLTRVTK